MILQPICELIILFPAAFTCFLATAGHWKVKGRTLTLLVVSVLTAVCVLGGGLCWRMGWPTNHLFLPILIPAAAGFCALVELPDRKSVV